MRQVIQMLMVMGALVLPVCQAQTIVTNDGVIVTVDNPESKPKYEEPGEITRCRRIWTNSHFRCEGGTDLWQCIVITRRITIDEYARCRQAVLDGGWTPDKQDGGPPSAVPARYTSASESFHMDTRALWLTYSDDGIRLRVRRRKE